MAFLHDVSKQLLFDAYRTQEWVHTRLAEEYRKYGLDYYGRSRYLAFDEKTIHYDKNYGNIITGTGYNINTVHEKDGFQLGVAGLYKKLSDIEKEVHRKVLSDIYDSFNKYTDKALLDKFNTYDFSGLKADGFKKMIKASKELVYDVKQYKAWIKEVEDIIKKLDLKYKGKIKTTKHMINMRDLERLGQAILGRAIELCPVETGFLRTSGTLYVFSDFIRIIFECPYSSYVHENVNAIHPYGQAKFLETAVQEMLPNTSVWVEQTGMDSFVYGKYMKLEWEHDSFGKAVGDPKWVEKIGYSAVYIDIDVDLKITYNHHG